MQGGMQSRMRGQNAGQNAKQQAGLNAEQHIQRAAGSLRQLLQMPFDVRGIVLAELLKYSRQCLAQLCTGNLLTRYRSQLEFAPIRQTSGQRVK